MNWTQFVSWINDPAHTRDELKRAYTSLGLTGLAAGAPTLSYKGALLAHATSQPDTTAAIPPALAMAIGVPIAAPAVVPTPAPVATPAPAVVPTPAPVAEPESTQERHPYDLHRESDGDGSRATAIAVGGLLTVAAVLAILWLALAAITSSWPFDNGDDSSAASANADANANGGGANLIAATGPLAKFDVNHDGWLDTQEQATANQAINGSGTTNGTSTPAPTTAAVASSGTMPAFTQSTDINGWKVQGTAVLDENPIVKDWITKRLMKPDPHNWSVFPNVPNPQAPAFRDVLCKDMPNQSPNVDPNAHCVPDGLEYGMDESKFCQANMTCDVSLAGLSYFFYSGDYNFLGESCQGDGKTGCELLVYNVSNDSYTFRNQHFDNGFEVTGLYRNGDTLEWGTQGIVSHGAANMLNLTTFRNPLTGDVLNAGGDSSNSGGNCGHQPDACASVNIRVIVVAGSLPFAQATTTVSQ